MSPTGKAQCRCPKNYHGDGTVCLPQDPCNTGNGGCPSNSTICLYQGPGKVSRGLHQACPSVPLPTLGKSRAFDELQLPRL